MFYEPNASSDVFLRWEVKLCLKIENELKNK